MCVRKININSLLAVIYVNKQKINIKAVSYFKLNVFCLKYQFK
jgi:hypothetical protein